PTVIHHEDGASANTGLLQAPQDAIQRNDRCQHAAELLADFQRDGHHKGGPVVRSECQGLAAEYHRLQAGGKRPLQCLADKGVLVRPEVSRTPAFSIRPHGREIEDIGITGDKVLKQARHLRRSHGVIDTVEKPCKGQDLAFADKLLIKIDVEKLYLLADRTRELGLLHALGIGKLFLAQTQNLKMIQPQRQGADEEHRAQNQKQQSGTVFTSRFAELKRHRQVILFYFVPGCAVEKSEAWLRISQDPHLAEDL